MPRTGPVAGLGGLRDSQAAVIDHGAKSNPLSTRHQDLRGPVPPSLGDGTDRPVVPGYLETRAFRRILTSSSGRKLSLFAGFLFGKRTRTGLKAFQISEQSCDVVGRTRGGLDALKGLAVPAIVAD